MKTIATLVLCVAATLARADYAYKQAFSETHPFNANGEISLANVNGNVAIRTWDRPEVKIEGEKSAKTEEELKLIGLTIDAKADALAVKTDFPKRSGGWSWFGGDTIRAAVEITLTVPATARLRKIDSVNGRILIEGVRGPVTARSVNGGVTAKGLTADTSLETVNGTIRAEFASVSADQQITARTVNGATTIALPKDANITVRARTVNGGVSCDLPIKLEGKLRRSSLTGTIGTGSATLKAETVNGGVHVTQL